MNRRAQVALLFACLMPTVGCGTVRGEQVESGFGSEIAPVANGEAAGSQTDATTPQQAVPAAMAATAKPTSTGEPLAFTGTELFAGSAVDGRALLDGASLITFVTPDCEFSTFHADLLTAALATSDDVTQVIVHTGTTRQSAQVWVDQVGLVGEHVVHLDDDGGVLARRFGVEAFPTTLLVTADGRLSKTEGALDQTRIDAALAIVRG
ncbi:MAG: TlpA family protein disulfide reductase [Ilumatobacter sp.]